MGEPKAVTYKEAKKAAGGDTLAATALWEKIGEVVGAGKVPAGIDEDGAIDLTDVSEAKRSQIDKLLAPEEPAAESKTSKKDGAK